jgi:hypothetical protein
MPDRINSEVFISMAKALISLTGLLSMTGITAMKPDFDQA